MCCCSEKISEAHLRSDHLKETTFPSCFSLMKFFFSKEHSSPRLLEKIHCLQKSPELQTIYLPLLAHISTCMLKVFICKLPQRRGSSLQGLCSVNLAIKLGHALFPPSLSPISFALSFIILQRLSECAV